MARNVEIKARLVAPEATRRLVAALADGPAERVEQTDTLFPVTGGRLKLRENPAAGAELIFYRRRDARGPAASTYAKIAVADGTALRELLAKALGVAGRVRKRRLVYRIGRTRVHLDAVEGLGDFLELEVVLRDGERVAAGAGEARRLMRRLGIRRAALVAGAYADLLERGRRQRRPLSRRVR
jgi:predicted adenylyl cyclase CyaB